MTDSPLPVAKIAASVNAELASPPDDVEEFARGEQVAYEKHRQTLQLREFYAYHVFWLAVGCIAIQYAVLLMHGFGCIVIEPEVMISVVFATVAEVIGVLVVIVKSVFPGKE